MKTIIIKQKNGAVHNVLVDDDAPDEVFSKKWHILRSSTSPNKFYVIRKHNGKTLWMHRVVTNCPPDMQIDHINNIGTDNRRDNLRIATQSQNVANVTRRRDNTSGMKGVSRQGVSQRTRNRKWRAYIRNNGKSIHIGYFGTKEEAYTAYCSKAKEIHGEFFNAG